MIWLYRALYWPFFLLLLPRYAARLVARGGKWHLKERLGGVTPPAKQPGVERLWIQAVSVGELNAITRLLKELKEMPGVEVVLSVTTTTARALAEEKLKGLYSYLFTFPLDHCAPKVLKRLQADRLILVERELWPELLQAAEKQKVPVFLINARLSDKSYRRMRALGGATAWILRKISLILASNKQDMERFLQLGANPELVYMTGNLKLDTLRGQAMSQEKKVALAKSLGWGPNERILLGASTWPGEELAMLQAWQRLRKKHPGLKLLIVPRHAERGNEVETLLKNMPQVSYHRRSSGAAKGSPEVVLADTTGELAMLTELAEIVFVGKSLRPHLTGQSPIDAAAAGKPILMGPGMESFREIAAELAREGGARWVGGPAELAEALGELLDDPSQARKMGQAAKGWHEKNQHATERVLEYMELGQAAAKVR